MGGTTTAENTILASFSSKLLSDKNIDWLQFFCLSRQSLKLSGNFRRKKVARQRKCIFLLTLAFIHRIKQRQIGLERSAR